MPLTPGQSLLHYRLAEKIGEGGMGEVYRAHDTKLRRDVAIKVLPQAFTEDRERLARFEREAQLLAQLHHPNIASIFGIEEAGGVRALVMELVEGPTLADRLAQGAIPVSEALALARQIAEALEEAHEKGIVHRDLKPANIKLTSEGKVKVLDFGLAKALDPTSSAASGGSRSASLMNSPTLTSAGTQAGMILGTAAYMAPEQAAGATVDRRADIWAFGVVLFEMLTGRRLFEGESFSHVLAGVLKDTPDFSTLPAETPERIGNLVRRCLRKKPRERLQAIGDARVVIEEVLADPQRGETKRTEVLPSSAPGRALVPWALAVAGLAAAALFAVLWLGVGREDAVERAFHAALVAPPGTGFGDTFALSPDGRRIAFEAYDKATGERSLWLRELDRGEARRLEATRGGEMPFWSPDGGALAFFAEGKLLRLDPAGGPAQTICEAAGPRGGSWGADGRIVFAPSFRTGLSIVPATGGTPEVLTTLDEVRNEKSHRFPVFLPGGKTLLFLAQTAEGGARNDASGIDALDLASGQRTRLVVANSSPLHALDHLLYWRDGTLLAQRFDAARLAVAGAPAAVAAPVAYTQNEQVLAAVAGDGTLVYREGARGVLSSLVWLDRQGIGTEVIQDRALFGDFALSHDGRRLVYAVNAQGQGATDLWIRDLDRGTAGRLTFDEGGEAFPVWSRDDRFIYYRNDRRNDGVIFRRAADGTGSAEELGTTPQGIWPNAVSADGRWLAIIALGDETAFDIMRFDVATKSITPLVQTPFVDEDATLSPDDRLMAYTSEQSGRREVYVTALAGERGTWQISTESGLGPRFSADGRELFFLARPDRLMVVDVEPGEVPRFSTPRELFRHPISAFDVTPDGRRIVALRAADADAEGPLTLVTSWSRRVGER